MPRKPLTPEQKAEKNRRAREKYAAGRAANLTPKQAKSLRKTFKENPNLIKDENVVSQLSNYISGLADLLASGINSAANSIDKLAENLIDENSPKTKKTRDPIRKNSAKKPKKRKKKKAPIPGVSLRPEERRTTDDFAEYVHYYPNASASQIIKFYREETGKSIGNDKAYRIIREVREAGKQYEKVRFKMYGIEDNPSKKKYLMQKGRFVYVVRYEVEVEGAAALFDQYIHITSSRELKPSEIMRETIAAFQKGQEFGKERYIAKRIDPNSITILYGVDTWKKTAS